MSMVLWTSADDGIDLGDPFLVMRAWQELSDVLGDDAESYAQLGEVLDRAEQEVDDEWLAMVTRQAAEVLREYGDVLSDDARGVLALLSEAR